MEELKENYSELDLNFKSAKGLTELQDLNIEMERPTIMFISEIEPLSDSIKQKFEKGDVTQRLAEKDVRSQQDIQSSNFKEFFHYNFKKNFYTTSSKPNEDLRRHCHSLIDRKLQEFANRETQLNKYDIEIIFDTLENMEGFTGMADRYDTV